MGQEFPSAATGPTRPGSEIYSPARKDKYSASSMVSTTSVVTTVSGAFQVEEINDIEKLAGYRLLWNSLLPQTRNASFFHGLDWLETYWRHFGRGQRLRVLIVSVGGKPQGILPLVVRRERTGIGPIRVLTYPLDGWGTFLGPIGPGATVTLLGAMKHVAATRRDWDTIDLRGVDVDRADHGRTFQAMRLAGFHARKQPWVETAMIDLQGTWQQYWMTRCEKWRNHVTRCQRRLSEQGELEHVRYRPAGAAADDGDPRWDLYDAGEGLAERSPKAARCDASCGPAVRLFLRDVHETAARSGSIDLNLLLLAGRPIAFSENLHYDGWVYELRTGSDGRFAHGAPGPVLQRMMIEDSFGRGDRVIDLGEGSMGTKRYWQSFTAASYRYAYYPLSSPRTQLLRAKRWLAERLHTSSTGSSSGSMSSSPGAVHAMKTR
jgi:CelD/BcsL family acetyltransferase involved in cellulose biosynthesis